MNSAPLTFSIDPSAGLPIPGSLLVQLLVQREDSRTPGLHLATRAQSKATAQRIEKEPLDEREQHRTWIRLAAEGDVSAYRRLCDRFLVPIHRYCQRLLGDHAEAEDVTQETFLRVWQHAHRYVPSAAPSTWIYRIAHNLCIDRLRSRKKTSERVSQLELEDRPSLLLDRKEIAMKVEEALAELPEKQRAAICLIHYEGLSQVEASEILETSVEALESLLARGRRSLRKSLASLNTENSP